MKSVFCASCKSTNVTIVDSMAVSARGIQYQKWDINCLNCGAHGDSPNYEFPENSLYFRIQHDFPLTETEKQSLYELLANRRRGNTKNRLWRVIFNNVYTLYNCGIMRRVLFDQNGQVSYQAGQSYPDEINTIVGILTGKIAIS